MMGKMCASCNKSGATSEMFDQRHAGVLTCVVLQDCVVIMRINTPLNDKVH